MKEFVTPKILANLEDTIVPWKLIDAFPNYEVSDAGEIRNIKTGRHVKPLPNLYGVLGVSLYKDGLQFRRSVPLLVVNAFLLRPYPAFDTPINLDGDRHNNHVANLMWRPRWFAVEYNRQFKERYANPINDRIKDVQSGEVWKDSWDCALSCGLLESDVVLSIMNNTLCWPTYQHLAVMR